MHARRYTRRHAHRYECRHAGTRIPTCEVNNQLAVFTSDWWEFGEGCLDLIQGRVSGHRPALLANPRIIVYYTRDSGPCGGGGGGGGGCGGCGGRGGDEVVVVVVVVVVMVVVVMVVGPLN